MSPDFRASTTPFSAGVTLTLSVTFLSVTLSVTLVPDTILLKKKGASYAIARLPSFDGTDKPRAPFITQNGGAA
jgi:hypothetical protein